MDKIINDIYKNLEQKYKDEQLILIKKQVKLLFDIIQQTEKKYQYSHDYREAIDIILGLIISGKFI